MKRVPILDPQSVPVISRDTELLPVPGERMTAGALRHRFSTPTAWEPELPGDGRLFVEREPSAASVLMPLVMRPEGLRVLLTRRTDHLHDHAGQISFPGGRSEPQDTDPVATALRETEEEVGLARSHVEVIGALPIYSTGTAYEVTPVVGLVSPGFTLALDTFEVAEAFEVPLAFLMNPANHQRHLFEYEGGARTFLAMPWNGIDDQGQPRSYFIWGATASMLRNLYGFLSA